MKQRFVPVLIVILSILMLVLAVGCKKKEKQEISIEELNKMKEKLNKEEPKENQDQDSAKISKKVKIETTMGDIVVGLYEEKSPITVKNFLGYVEEGFYDNTIFHRVIKDFMVQGGGLTSEMQKKSTHPAIVNEAKNGLKNERGTIAMARTGNPDSATAQFFINHKDNAFLNYKNQREQGYAVFGEVTEGMETVEKIAVVQTTTRNGMGDVPAEIVVIKSVKLVSDD